MDNQTLQKIKDTLVKSNNIGIAVGADPSVDSMAGALSLYLLLKAANKQVSVACPTEPIVELSSLVGINRVQKSLGGDASDLVVSFPYVEGEIEKVSYTLEEGFLNIIVKASEQGLSFDEKDVRYVRGSGAVDLLIVVGTSRLSELEDVFDSQKLRDVRIINIDNKDANQGFGDIVLVSPNFSSVSEQVADLALALGFRMEQDVAQNLLTGITTETKNFQTPNVTPLTFEMMALLMKTGAARRNIETRSPLSVSDDELDQPAPRFPSREQQRSDDDRPARQQQQSQRQDDQRRQDQARQAAQNQNDDNDAATNDEEPPLDWLTPKVYKGSSDVD